MNYLFEHFWITNTILLKELTTENTSFLNKEITLICLTAFRKIISLAQILNRLFDVQNINPFVNVDSKED